MTNFVAACAEVEAWLSSLGPSIETLSPSLIQKLYRDRGFAQGWRLRVAFSDSERLLDLLLPEGFPWQPPRVALVDAPEYLTWPHVERDHVLCLTPNTSETNPDDPVGVAAFLLGEAEEAINDFIAGKCYKDFSDEFLTYWHNASDSGMEMISLLRAEGPARMVSLWRGKKFYLLAESPEEVRSWLANRHGNAAETVKPIEAVFAWVGTPSKPRDYPHTGVALRSLLAAHSPTALQMLEALAADNPNEVTTVLGFDTANGPALAGVLIKAPNKEKYGPQNPISKGFRRGKVPNSVLAARFFGGQAIVRRPIERADASWIHGRGNDSRTEKLRRMKVVLLGCGSLGAPIAIALAQAGLGHQILVDFDMLKYANTSRHPLGSSSVDKMKARALAMKLRADFPHAKFDFLEADVDTCVRKHSEILNQADLIIAATGSWAADSRLDAWQSTVERKVPILYTWMEAHATSGHAILLDGDCAALKSGFNETGVPHFRVANWPGGSPLRQEPACGAIYQPYGAIELGFVCNLASELALDALLGNMHAPIYRLWIGPSRRLHELGGEWTASWRADQNFRDVGGFLTERAWGTVKREKAA